MSYAEQVTRTVVYVRRVNGIAGQFVITATVRTSFPDAADQVSATSFVGSIYGGAPVMVMPDDSQHHVSDAGRFGDFSTSPFTWVKAFFADDPNPQKENTAP
jgi:hypothetical protein